MASDKGGFVAASPFPTDWIADILPRLRVSDRLLPPTRAEGDPPLGETTGSRRKAWAPPLSPTFVFQVCRIPLVQYLAHLIPCLLRGFPTPARALFCSPMSKRKQQTVLVFLTPLSTTQCCLDSSHDRRCRLPSSFNLGLLDQSHFGSEPEDWGLVHNFRSAPHCPASRMPSPH